MKPSIPNRYKYIAFENGHVYRRFIQNEAAQIQQQTKPSEHRNFPVHGSYAALLFDVRWKQKRADILIRDANRCVICGSHQDLQVHHRQYHFISKTKQYKAPWDYADRLLISLCESCHGRGHSKFKIPIINI